VEESAAFDKRTSFAVRELNMCVFTKGNVQGSLKTILLEVLTAVRDADSSIHTRIDAEDIFDEWQFHE
jgi:hypothetical protein